MVHQSRLLVNVIHRITYYIICMTDHSKQNINAPPCFANESCKLCSNQHIEVNKTLNTKIGCTSSHIAVGDKRCKTAVASFMVQTERPLSPEISHVLTNIRRFCNSGLSFPVALQVGLGLRSLQEKRKVLMTSLVCRIRELCKVPRSGRGFCEC